METLKFNSPKLVKKRKKSLLQKCILDYNLQLVDRFRGGLQVSGDRGEQLCQDPGQLQGRELAAPCHAGISP